MKISKYLLLCLIPLLFNSCADNDNKVHSLNQENSKVSVLKISAQSNLLKLNYSGSIEPDNTVKIGFAIPGIINKVYVEEGQLVKKGQLLATIDDTEYRNSLSITEAALSQTEDLYRRLKDLFEKESLPEKDFIDIKTKLAQARASKNINTKRINDCRLYAPMSGYITGKAIEAGSSASPGLPAFDIIKTYRVYAQFTVPEAEIGHIANGQAANVFVPTLQDTLKGKISLINPQADAQTKTYKVKILLNNAGRKLLPGMLSDVQVETGRKGKRIAIPATAIVRDEDNLTYVFVVNNQNKAVRRRIVSGDLDGDQVMISSGLEINDRVVVSGQKNIKDGQAVTITGA